jgi:outer membrane immunogenic protein
MNHSKSLWLLSLCSCIFIEFLNSGVTFANERSSNSDESSVLKLDLPLTKISFSEAKVILDSQQEITASPKNNSQLISQSSNPDSNSQPKNLYFGAGAGLFFPSISGTVGITGGTSTPQSATVNFGTSSDIGYNVFAGLKTSFGRAELEMLASKNSINKTTATSNGQTASISSTGDVTNFAVMLNGYYDFSTGSKFTPYVGGGIGYGSTTITANNDTRSGSGLTYQLKAGAAYTISDNTDIYLQYRYLNNPNVTGSSPGGNGSTVTGSINSNSSSIEIGTRYAF